MQKYDVIIAGGGPAGSTAGFILSKAGFKVLLIDKSKFPRHKLCAGCVTDKTVKLVERVFGETVANLKDKSVINFESSRYEIFSGKKLVTRLNMPLPFYFVERYTYDNFFLRKARQAGAEVLEGEPVSSFNLSESEIITASGKTFSARFIIGADGVNSLIRRQFPEERFDRKAWHQNAGIGLEIFIDHSNIPGAFNHPALYFNYIDYGYAWLFPHRDKLVAGIGGLTQKNKKKFLPAFYNFLSELNIEAPQQYNVKSYSFPYGNYLLNPVFRNVILAGDAAGFADPLLGEGIYYAQRSAELAAQSIIESTMKERQQDLIDTYLSDMYLGLLQKDIYQEFVYAGKIRNFVFKYFPRFHHLPLKILMEMLGKKPLEAVHGIRSYKWFKIKEVI